MLNRVLEILKKFAPCRRRQCRSLPALPREEAAPFSQRESGHRAPAFTAKHGRRWSKKDHLLRRYAPSRDQVILMPAQGGKAARMLKNASGPYPEQRGLRGKNQ